MSFGRPPSINVGFKTTPPNRGSFPLDHYGECSKQMKEYMECLKKNSGTSTHCRTFSKQYLECRMSKGLMERDEWHKLGLGDVEDATGTKARVPSQFTMGLDGSYRFPRCTRLLPRVGLAYTKFFSLNSNKKFYDVQSPRPTVAAEGILLRALLPSFAWGLVDGSTTLELDNGITLDGEVIVWHDVGIMPEKCRDTNPVVPNDPMFPYVGKLVANLTLAQIQTLDCGSQRQAKYPQQLLYPWRTDPDSEGGLASKDFVQKQHSIFRDSPYYRSITYQSFDWRTLVAMKELDPTITTSALIDEDTLFAPEWLAGLQLDSFPGPSLGEQMAQAAHTIKADILSPTATVLIPSPEDPSESVKFTTQSLIDEVHRLGMQVNRLDIADELHLWGADGIITDYPNVVRRWAKQQGLSVAPKFPKQRVFSCLEKHMQKV
ncbi:PLC-like phosphodiesterase [Pisolithus croceorrhizus]|nr:PLC-like phosphodiesterase [Pisolithus croceorrhizus]